MPALTLSLPTVATNQPGTAVDVSALGAVKTIVASTSGSLIYQTYVLIEISNDTGVAPSNWTPVYQFQRSGSQQIVIACRWMRATTQNIRKGQPPIAPTVSVTADDTGSAFDVLDVPVGNGMGAALDISALDPFKTIQVSGSFRGSLNIQSSNDGVVFTQVPGMSFQTKGGIWSQLLVANYLRVNRNGIPANAKGVGFPVVTIGAADRRSAPVPPEPRAIDFMAGQSNTIGQEQFSSITIRVPELADPSANVRLAQKTAQVRNGPYTTNAVGFLAPYTSSVANNSGATTNLIGPELTFGRVVGVCTPNNVDIAKFGMSGTNLPDWLTTLDLATQMLNYMDLVEQTLNATIRSFTWGQGESDAMNASDAANYATNLTTLFDRVRAVRPDLPILIVQLNPSCTATHTATVRAAQASVASSYPNCTLIQTEGLALLPDGFHYTGDGYTSLGVKCAMAVIDALGIDPPWTRDATGKFSLPADEDEWIAFLDATYLDLVTPENAWLMQGAGPSIEDTIGDADLAPSGSLEYGVAIPGLSRVGVRHTNGVNGFLSSTAAELPDLASDSISLLDIVYLSAVSGAERIFNGIGVSVGSNASLTTTPRFKISSGANTATGTVNPLGSVRPYLTSVNRVGLATYGASDQEKLVPTTVSNLSGKRAFFGSGVGPPTGTHAAAYLWRAAISAAVGKGLLSDMNFYPLWS